MHALRVMLRALRCMHSISRTLSLSEHGQASQTDALTLATQCIQGIGF